MSASAKKRAANLANAQHSTGPVTEGGKAISSQNAVKHGLTGQAICRTYNDQQHAYDAYYESMLPELAPATALELDFAKRIVHDSWRLNRAGAMDDNLLANGRHENGAGYSGGDDYEEDALREARAFRADAKTFNLLSLYEQRLQRAILKNLAVLNAMQKERKSAVQTQAKPAARASEPSPQPIEIPVPPPVGGFVFADALNDPAPPLQDAKNDPQNMAA